MNIKLPNRKTASKNRLHIKPLQPKEYTYLGDVVLEKHRVEIDFASMQLPRVINNDGGKKYLDPIRHKGICVTPEETVRQRVLRYLLDVCEIPAKYIHSEDHMAHYDETATIRADITVRYNDETVLVIECKAPKISIDGAPITQIFDYNRILQSKYLLITNGFDSYIFGKTVQGSYEPCLTLPKFSEIITRPSLAEMNSKTFIRDYKNNSLNIGIDTPDVLVPFIANLTYAFLDVSHTIENTNGYGVEIIKDNKIINDTMTNASNRAYPGMYRQFLVRNRHKKDCLVSFSVLGTCSGYTSLICTVDRDAKAISRLQLRLDKFCSDKKSSMWIYHDGTRSQKRKQPTIDYVKSICESLVMGNLIDLGFIPNNKLIYLTDDSMSDFVLRLTAYTLLRDEMSVAGM